MLTLLISMLFRIQDRMVACGTDAKHHNLSKIGLVLPPALTWKRTQTTVLSLDGSHAAHAVPIADASEAEVVAAAAVAAKSSANVVDTPQLEVGTRELHTTPPPPGHPGFEPGSGVYRFPFFARAAGYTRRRAALRRGGVYQAARENKTKFV